MKEDPPITDEFYLPPMTDEFFLQAEKEIEEGTVDEYCWSLAEGAGINEHDVEIHYMNLRIGQLKHEEMQTRYRKDLIIRYVYIPSLVLGVISLAYGVGNNSVLTFGTLGCVLILVAANLKGLRVILVDDFFNKSTKYIIMLITVGFNISMIAFLMELLGFSIY